MKKSSNEQGNPSQFSLGIGGPLYNLLNKTGLIKKPLLRYKRRIAIITLITWLPLLIFTLLNNTAHDEAYVSFIYNIDVHVRLLLVLSMLIFAEVIAHDRIHLIVEQFLKSHIIPASHHQKFFHIIRSAAQLRDSRLAEAILILLVYTVGHWISIEYFPSGISAWLFEDKNNPRQLTLAGYWYTYISLPVFQFFMLRWYFRIVVWYRFLWQVSRLPLQLNSLHPDRAGGLGFLINSIFALQPFLTAHSVLLTGIIFNRIWNTGATIADFQTEIIGIVFFAVTIPLNPLLFFMVKMAREKRIGTLNYNVTANRYVNDFRRKWITSPTNNQTPILGTSDIQSLADLFNSFEVTNKMRITPFNKNCVTTLITVMALPLLPLLLTIIPIEKIVSQLFGLIF